MGNCQVQKGLFALKECGEFASIQCTDCQKFVCNQHSQQDGGLIICSECYGKKHQDSFTNNKRGGFLHDDRYFMMWYFANRNSFYHNSHYTPFDRNNFDNFDRQNQQELNDDNESGGFFDS